MNRELAEKFYKIMEELRKVIVSKNKLGELSKSEISMLYSIKQCSKEQGYVITSDLSEQLNISKPATSQMINILEDKKYIQRIINKDDRRLMCVAITEHGNQVMEETMRLHLDNISVILGMMEKQDSELFVELLDKYVSKVKEFIQQQR